MAGQIVSRWGKMRHVYKVRLGVLKSGVRFGLKMTVSYLRTLCPFT